MLVLERAGQSRPLNEIAYNHSQKPPINRELWQVCPFFPDLKKIVSHSMVDQPKMRANKAAIPFIGSIDPL